MDPRVPLRHPFRHGIAGNPAPDSGINNYGLPASEVTIASNTIQATIQPGGANVRVRG